MGVLGDKGSWCFCSGGDARSERVKGSIYTAKGPSIASICSTTGGERKAFGTGFMIHKGLLLTTHTNIPSVTFAETGCDVKLGFGRIQARLVPQRFFITSSILDLTIVGLDAVSDETLNYIKTGFNTTLDLGNTTYLLGHTTPRNDLTIGEGKIVISTDNLIKLSTDSFSFSPGSAGFDMHGNLSFMLCDPMKLATSPMARSGTGTVPTCGYSLSRKDSPMQFGVPVPVILDWLRQHWSGSLDEVTKPKLDPPVRLVSGPSKGGLRNGTGESSASNPKMNLLDINFPPRPAPPPRSIFLPLPLKQMLSEGCNSNNYDNNNNNNNNNHNDCNNNNNDDYDNNAKMNVGPSRVRAEVESEQESNCCYSEVQSSSSPVHLHYYDDGFTTGDDETMYSAETMESRNIPSPRRKTLNPNPSFENNYESRVSSVGRSQSCVNNTRWSSSPVNRGVLSKQNSLVPVRRSNSQTGPQRNSQDFLSPTVSSAMKKRNSVEKEKQVVPIIRAKQGPNRGPSKWVS